MVNVNVGLMGYGTVGSGVYEVVRDRTPDIHIKRILVRSMKDRDPSLFTCDADSFIQDETMGTVVEAISDAKEAKRLVLWAMECGKNVVTSNKELISHHLPELSKKAEEMGVQLCYESTVGAGLPWLRTIREIRKINTIHKVYGNLNGTSNFILDLMRKDGIDFEQALLKSRMLRYQEPNYKDDISGVDARNKLAITMMLAFNTYVHPEDIPTYGIETIRNLDFGFFQRHKLTLKPMSYAVKNGNRMCMLVAPTLYRNDRLRANVGGNNNLLGLNGDIIGKVEFIGEGAGKYATANGVVTDLLFLKEGGKHDPLTLEELRVDETLLSYKFYFSFDQGSYQIERILLPYVYSISETNDSFILTTRNISLDTCLELLWKIEQTDERFFFAVYEEADLIR